MNDCGVETVVATLCTWVGRTPRQEQPVLAFAIHQRPQLGDVLGARAAEQKDITRIEP